MFKSCLEALPGRGSHVAVWILKRLVSVLINACRLLSTLPSLLQFGRGRLSLVAISFYSLSLLFGPCRLSRFTLAGPLFISWTWFKFVFFVHCRSCLYSTLLIAATMHYLQCWISFELSIKACVVAFCQLFSIFEPCLVGVNGALVNELVKRCLAYILAHWASCLSSRKNLFVMDYWTGLFLALSNHRCLWVTKLLRHCTQIG